MGFLKKIKAKFEDFLQFEEEWQACILGNMIVQFTGSKACSQLGSAN